MYNGFLEWLKENQIGDLTGIIGLVISLIGFFATILGVYRAKASSERAELAVKKAMEGVKLFDTAVDFTSAISILEEIKRHHRQEQWILLLDRYATIRKILILIRSANNDLDHAQQSVIQLALTNIRSIEQTVEKNLEDPVKLKASKFNPIISQDIDGLVALFIEIKSRKTGARI